jgi:hypothetical protein
LVDLTVPPFSHGHLNVALSRIQLALNIGYYGNTEQYDKETSMFQTINIVYNEILQVILNSN